MSSIGEKELTLRKLYDQAEIEADHPATLSAAPVQYKDNIYYIEVAWDDYAIANSNKKYQFVLGTYAWGNSWDPTDDWSHQDLKEVDDPFKGTVEKCEYICVYDDGVLVGGTEPDGTTPDNAPKATASPKPTESPKPTATPKVTESPKPTTTPKTSETPKASPSPTGTNKTETLLGDVNLDGSIDVTDLSTLALALVDKSELKGQSFTNADIDGDKKIALTDLATLRQYLSKKITKLG